MPAERVLSGGVPDQPERADGLSDAVEAVYAYLREIDSYRDVCRRSEGTAVIQMHDAGLEVARSYAHREEATTHLRSALGRLPAGAGVCETGGPTSARLRRCITWENRLMIASVCPAGPEATALRVALVLPDLESDLPKLPLRTLANALLCHEFLVPAFIATPLPPPREPASLTVREYLKRTMPPNLYASQCI